jgi:hypothetical protein
MSLMSVFPAATLHQLMSRLYSENDPHHYFLLVYNAHGLLQA